MPRPKAKFLLPGRCWSIHRPRSEGESSRAKAAPSSVEGMEPVGATSVFLFALLTAVATGLGAVPFAFAKHPTRRWLGVSNAVAAGLMLAASFGLIYEGMHYGPLRALVGALLGLVFIVVARRSLQHEEHPAVFASMSGFDARKALLIVGVMTIHSFTEGVGMGVPAFFFVEVFRPLLPYGLGFAAGAMIWMVFSELVPDSLEETSSNLVAVVITVSVVAMVAFQVLIR